MSFTVDKENRIGYLKLTDGVDPEHAGARGIAARDWRGGRRGLRRAARDDPGEVLRHGTEQPRLTLSL